MATVRQISSSSIRITYDGFPLTSDPQGSNDALNISNYTLLGPGIPNIVDIQTISGDVSSVDLFLDAPLTLGTWTLFISSNIQTGINLPNTSLGAGQSYTIEVTGLTIFYNQSNGTVNDDPETTLKNHFNPALKGKAWSALLAAIATGDKTNIENAKAAFDQLFISKASGKYLDQKGHDYGLDRPETLGLIDDLYRQLIIKLTASKLTQDDILDVLEIFYGLDAVKAFNLSNLNEPFALSDGDDLQIVLNEDLLVNVVFNANEFLTIGQAKAIEVAAAITRAVRNNGNDSYAIADTDPTTGNVKVKIYSNTLGARSSVRVIGGRAQNFLEFSSRTASYSGVNPLPTWSIVKNIADGIVTFTTATDPTRLNLSLTIIGDYVNIFGNEFNSANRGSFPILDVTVSYPAGILTQIFKIKNDTGVNEAVVQLSETSAIFYKPEKRTAQSGSRTVSVSQHDNQTDVSVPATTQAVNRTELTAAYLNSNAAIPIVTLLRREDGIVNGSFKGIARATTSTAHGLSVGDQIIIDEAFGGTSGPAVNVGAAGFTDSSLKSIVSNVSNTVNTYVNHQAFYNKYDGRVIVLSTDIFTGHSERFRLIGTGVAQPDGSRKYQHVWDAVDTTLVSAQFNRFFKSAVSYDTFVLNTNSLLIFSAIATGGDIPPPGGGIGNAIDGYNPLTNQWVDSGAVMAVGRAGHRSTLLNTGSILIVGGASIRVLGPIYTPTATAELFNKTTFASVLTGSMAEARGQHEQILLNDGRVLVTGGREYGVSTVQLDHTLNGIHGILKHTCEIYDPGAATWSKTGSMAYARFGHKLVKLPDGRVMAIGGFGYPANTIVTGLQVAQPLAQCEIYDPAVGYWQPAMPMALARDFPIVALTTKNGTSRVYALGGENNSTTSVTEYYDTKTGRWNVSTATPSSNLGFRAAPEGALINHLNSNDLLLVVGGYTKNVLAGTYSTSVTHGVEIPNSETFMAGGLNEVSAVTNVFSSFIFEYKTSAFLNWTNNISTTATVIPMKAKARTIIGPYIWDTGNAASTTSEQTFLIQDIVAGTQYPTISVADTSQITIDPTKANYIVIGFGTEAETFPVKINTKLGTTTFTTDYSFVFPKDVMLTKLTSNIAGMTRTGGNLVTVTTTSVHRLEVGQKIYVTPGEANFPVGPKIVTAIVNSTQFRYAEIGIDTSSVGVQQLIVDTISFIKLVQKSTFIPDHPEDFGSFYITAANDGRIVALSSIDKIAAAGVLLNKTVDYPGDRGLGNEGYPDKDSYKLSDVVEAWGSDAIDEELQKLRGSE